MTRIGTSVEVDIPCDPTQIDATGMPWAFLDEAARADVITKGGIVVTGDAGDPVFARIASVTPRNSGIKVHFEILPGEPREYVEAARVVWSMTRRRNRRRSEPRTGRSIWAAPEGYVRFRARPVPSANQPVAPNAQVCVRYATTGPAHNHGSGLLAIARSDSTTWMSGLLP